MILPQMTTFPMKRPGKGVLTNRLASMMKASPVSSLTGGERLWILVLWGTVTQHHIKEAKASCVKIQLYDFTDTSEDTLETIRAKLASWGKLVSYKTLAVEVLPKDQGFETESYDVVVFVVASNHLLGTTFTHDAIKHIHCLLQPGGKFIIVEDTNLKKCLRSPSSGSLDGQSDDRHSMNGGHNLLNSDLHYMNGTHRPLPSFEWSGRG